MPGTPAPESVTIDAETGLIVSLRSLRPGDPVTEDEAMQIAEEFAQRWVPDFDAMTLHGSDTDGSHTTPEGQVQRVFTARWVLMDPESGAWLPTLAVVGVNLETGTVSRFDQMAEVYDGPTIPEISEEVAEEIALQQVDENNLAQPGEQVEISDTELRVSLVPIPGSEESFPADAEYRLCWVVQLRGVDIGLWIDAIHGDVIAFE